MQIRDSCAPADKLLPKLRPGRFVVVNMNITFLKELRRCYPML
jgi:hypothetical protein